MCADKMYQRALLGTHVNGVGCNKHQQIGVPSSCVVSERSWSEDVQPLEDQDDAKRKEQNDH